MRRTAKPEKVHPVGENTTSVSGSRHDLKVLGHIFSVHEYERWKKNTRGKTSKDQISISICPCLKKKTNADPNGPSASPETDAAEQHSSNKKGSVSQMATKSAHHISDGAKYLAGLARRRKRHANLSPSAHGLSTRVRQAYCMPTLSTLPVVTLLAVYLTDFYEALGARLSALSFYIALARSLDVTSDPLMSYLTDSCRSRWGRRRPFCVTGCWFYAAFLMALLNPPDLSATTMGNYFGLFYILFFLANTYTTIPYDALGPELTDNYEDRSRLFFVSGLYDGIGALIAITLPQFFAQAADLYYTGCDYSTCYDDSGVGTDCLPDINTQIYDTYDLGFSTSGTTATSTDDIYEAETCVTNSTLSAGLVEYCACRATCATRCDLESQRVAFEAVGFFFGAWFCATMVSMFFNVKERSHALVPTAAGETPSPTTEKAAVGDAAAAAAAAMAEEGEEEDDKEGEEEAHGVRRLSDGEALDEELQGAGAGGAAAAAAAAARDGQGGLLSPRLPAHPAFAPALVPSLLNTFRNHPFVLLLPAWICDSIGFAIIASMTAYFVRYVVRPEYQTRAEHGRNCNEGIPIDEESCSWMCDSSYVLGASVTMLLVCAFLGTPFWLWAARRLGKRSAWLLWSLAMSLTNVLFLAVGKGDVVLCIILAGINGLPFGAKFLADAILSDIIDYDEFLTGQRNEATYTMFKSFLPKICAIPAAAVPLAVLESLGHVAPVNGVVQPQPEIISLYCKFVSVIIPTALSVLSLILKARFPLKDKAMVDRIAVGIGQHLIGASGHDPISGVSYTLQKVESDNDLGLIDLMDYFPSYHWLRELVEAHEQEGEEPGSNTQDTVQKSTVSLTALYNRALRELVSSIALFVLSLVGVVLTFSWLTEDVLSIVPVLMVIVLGISVTSTLFSLLRCRGAARLRRAMPGTRLQLLRDVLAQREQLALIGRRAAENTRLADDLLALRAALGPGSGGGGGKEA